MRFRYLLIIVVFMSCSSSRWVQTDLYFGQDIPGGGSVTDAQWKQFKEKEIARVYHEGSTTVSAVGTWFDPDARVLITERSYIVSHLYKRSAAVSKQIDSLRNIYKSLFKQQSVLRVDKKVKVHF